MRRARRQTHTIKEMLTVKRRERRAPIYYRHD